MAVVIFLLAMLIAYLTSSISLDARVREHATMFAYGVKVRTALRMAITESALMGVVATVIGVAGGDSKIEAIHAILKGEVLDILITDDGVAKAIFERVSN